MSCRDVYAIGATALLATLANCGSGGDDGDGILPNGTSRPPTDTTSPPADEVSRAAVFSGLTRAVSKSASAAAPDAYFSVLRSSGLSQFDASEFQSGSFLAPFSSSAVNLESEVRLRLASQRTQVRIAGVWSTVVRQVRTVSTHAWSARTGLRGTFPIRHRQATG